MFCIGPNNWGRDVTHKAARIVSCGPFDFTLLEDMLAELQRTQALRPPAEAEKPVFLTSVCNFSNVVSCNRHR